MQKRMLSFKHAFRGILTAVQSEIHFRMHLVVMVATVALGFLAELNLIEWTIIVICIGLVLSAELFNTAIEAVCDLVTTEHHPIVKIIKDTSAGAVLILAITAFVVAVIIFIPKLLTL